MRQYKSTINDTTDFSLLTLTAPRLKPCSRLGALALEFCEMGMVACYISLLNISETLPNVGHDLI